MPLPVKILTLDELQAIQGLQQEYKDLQKIELFLVEEGGKFDTLLTKRLNSVLLYTNTEKIESMIQALEKIIKSYMVQSNQKGKLLANKAVDKFLSESEKRDIWQKQERLIRQLNIKRARRRLTLIFTELQKEKDILKADISLFIQRQKIMGVKINDILIDLVQMSRNKQGFAETFKKNVKRLSVDAVKFEQRQAEIDEYKLYTKPNEAWQWITISKNPCPDCRARAGVILPFKQWTKMGLPGSGNTICNKYCLCKLYPHSIAEDKFPQVKEFTLSKDKLVLTPVGEFNLMNKNKGK